MRFCDAFLVAFLALLGTSMVLLPWMPHTRRQDPDQQ